MRKYCKGIHVWYVTYYYLKELDGKGYVNTWYDINWEHKVFGVLKYNKTRNGMWEWTQKIHGKESRI